MLNFETFQGMAYCVTAPSTKHSSLFDEIVTRVQVFARVTPKQKEEVITTLKSQGEYGTAYTNKI